MTRKEEKLKEAEQRKRANEKRKMELAAKKLRIDLAKITAKAKRAQQLSKKWECDTDEKKWLSFVPDSNSDGDVEIDQNKCTKCDVIFEKDEEDVYGCDHCPRWFHKRCLPATVLAIAEAEGKPLAEIDVDCDYCTY